MLVERGAFVSDSFWLACTAPFAATPRDLMPQAVADFEEIRPYRDDEVAAVLRRLSRDPSLRRDLSRYAALKRENEEIFNPKTEAGRATAPARGPPARLGVAHRCGGANGRSGNCLCRDDFLGGRVSKAGRRPARRELHV